MKRYDKSQQVYKTTTLNGSKKIIPVRGLYVSGTHVPTSWTDTCIRVTNSSFTQPTITDHKNTPAGYTDLEYIVSTSGMACPIQQELEYVLDCAFINPTRQQLMGFYLQANGYFGINIATKIAAEWSINDATTHGIDDADPSERNVIHAKFENNQRVEVTVDGYDDISYGYPSGLVSDYSTIGQFSMFTLAGNSTTPIPMRFYRGTFKSLSGDVLYDYVPCKRNSDNVVGLYELIHDVFTPLNTSSYN